MAQIRLRTQNWVASRLLSDFEMQNPTAFSLITITYFYKKKTMVMTCDIIVHVHATSSLQDIYAKCAVKFSLFKAA